ncbi:MAG: VOC family protein [Candidatus Nanopelagicales bacterium]
MTSITPFLWFDGQAGEAAAFYTELFGDGVVTDTAYYSDVMPERAGQVLTVSFEIAGQKFVALNGGSNYAFSPATSFLIDCADQAEVDHYWDGLLADGGTPMQCGWLTDRFGVTWQVVPTRLEELMTDPDPEKASRAMRAMLGMVKIDIAELERAHAG